ncbi:tRNA (adenosine(37)-N6)-threonylcarbamoyltransferase complex ATPase subunit type 1 TsaE [Rickettsia sp. Oklahoma-10]|uniref:tRNA threonylcarbamoyladenosine biosynthesis protein TsaE n=1 Tax=Rickettsia oklahomensis TaxID=3141789 RepID=A0AAU7BZQ0_9RICK
MFINLNNEEETKNLAKLFAQNLKPNDIVLLNSDLGSGKTFFCREIIKYFCGEHTSIISPTFNLLQTYKASDFTIYHYDLYRLKSPEEIYELGFEDALNCNLILIEWSKIIKHLLPSTLIEVNLEVLDENKRLCSITTNNKQEFFLY